MSDSDNPYARPSAWGRPQQQPFTIGPLPKAAGTPPPAAPRRRSSIVSGGAQPARGPTPAQPLAAQPTRAAAQPERPPERAVERSPDPRPGPRPEPVQPPVAEPELAFAPLPRTAAPRASRTPLIAGGLAAGLAVAVAGGVGVFMLNNRSAPTETAPPAAGLAIETQAPVAATSPATGAPLAVLPETPQVSASATPPATAQPASAPVRQTRAEAPVLRPSARVERTAPAEVAPPPMLAVETPPLIVPPPAPVPVTPVGPPPAAAERPPADPSAPMTTRLPDGTD